MKRSLQTDSYSVAVRLARLAAFEIDEEFERTRQDNGLPFDDRLITPHRVGDPAEMPIPSRTTRSSIANTITQTLEVPAVKTQVLTLSDWTCNGFVPVT